MCKQPFCSAATDPCVRPMSETWLCCSKTLTLLPLSHFCALFPLCVSLSLEETNILLRFSSLADWIRLSSGISLYSLGFILSRLRLTSSLRLRVRTWSCLTLTPSIWISLSCGSVAFNRPIFLLSPWLWKGLLMQAKQEVKGRECDVCDGAWETGSSVLEANGE